MGVRKNVRSLTSAEKEKFVRAIKAVKADGVYDQYVLWHINSMTGNRVDANDSTGLRNAAHGGPAFLPWHRYYLYRFERQLQRRVPGVTIPYWDWTQDTANPSNSPIWTADFMGGNGNPVTTGPFASGQWRTIDENGQPKGGLIREFGINTGSLPNQNIVNTALNETPYDRSRWNSQSSPSHRNRLEGWLGRDTELHNQVHVWVGGDMLLTSSPNDPVFFLHHCNVDRLWALWQDRNPSQGYVPTASGPRGHNLNDLMYPWNGTTTRLQAKPADVINYKALNYTYE